MNKQTFISIFVLAILLIGGWLLIKDRAVQNEEKKDGDISFNDESNMPEDKNEQVQLDEKYRGKQAKVDTNYGSFVIQFYDDVEPKAVENFIRLSEEGKYNQVSFHRIIKDFMIQTGDFTKGDGTGGESIFGEPFEGNIDINNEVYKTGYVRGVVAMANFGCPIPKSNGSQFFIMHADLPLDPCYPIFGHVVSGLDVIDKIANVPTLENDYGEPSVPTEKITVENITIEDK